MNNEDERNECDIHTRLEFEDNSLLGFKIRLLRFQSPARFILIYISPTFPQNVQKTC
jgi:hypothetical protein